MFAFLRGVSLVGLVAVAGFGAAIFGAFLGWIFFPVAVSFGVNQVYKLHALHIHIFVWKSTYKSKYLWLLMLTANDDKRRNWTIWSMERYTTTITFQSLYIQCDKSKGNSRRCHTKCQRNWTIHLSVKHSSELTNKFKSAKNENASLIQAISA